MKNKFVFIVYAKVVLLMFCIEMIRYAMEEIATLE